MTATKVSIIVPVYNSERYLRACVASILAQDHHEIEVILVDDGSTDSSGLICDDFASVDDRVVVIHRENGGIGAAQNSGLDVASGELVTFCDNDDLMSPRLISRLVEILEVSAADMSCCRWRNLGASTAEVALRADADDPAGRFIVFRDPAAAYQQVFSVLLRRVGRAELRYFSEANWGKLYRASMFDGLRFPEGSYAQDVAIAMDLYGRIDSVASCDDALYYWLQRADSVSHQLRSTRYYHDIVRAHARSFEIAMDRGILPARAYCGLKTIRVQRRSVVTAEDAQLFDDDARLVRRLFARLSLRQRLACRAMYAIRMLEVEVYKRTVHRRR